VSTTRKRIQKMKTNQIQR